MAITWANILEWETAPLDEIAQTLFEASQGLRKAYEKGEDDLKAVQSEGEAVNAMRATTLANLASLERALTNVNGALMAIEGARDGVGTVIHCKHRFRNGLRQRLLLRDRTRRFRQSRPPRTAH